MRVIKNGFEREFLCRKCASVFIAGKGEYNVGTVRIGEEKKKALFCRCPVCQKRTYIIPENEEGELFNGN